MGDPHIRRAGARVLLAVWAASSALAQTYTIKTFTGGGLPDNIPGTSAGFSAPAGIAADAAGNVFFTSLNAVFRLDARTGTLTHVAGNGAEGFSGDNGPAIDAQLTRPMGLAVDTEGNLFIADRGNGRIRKVSRGVITTVAGSNANWYGDNVPATSFTLSGPTSVAVDNSGNLYIVESSAQTVYKVSNGVIATLAGSRLHYGFSGDNGPAIDAALAGPSAVAVDNSGNVYIADSGNNRIRKVTNGVITTVAGNGLYYSESDSPVATSVSFGIPIGVTVDASGNLYIALISTNNIRKVSNGMVTTVAGSGSYGFSGDNGPAIDASLSLPAAVAVDPSGSIYIADSENNRIRKVSNGIITTVGGMGACCFGGDNGPASAAGTAITSRQPVSPCPVLPALPWITLATSTSWSRVHKPSTRSRTA